MGLFKSNNPFRHAAGQSSAPPSQQHGAGAGGGNNDDYAPPPGPPPSYTINNNNNSNTNPFLSSDQKPKQHGYDDEQQPYYAPPPGPPPSSSSQNQQQEGQGQQQQQQQQHPWESVVPDTSLFPPPPDIFSGFDRSSASNATEAQAEAGEAWCRRYPLAPPTDLRRGQQEGLWQFASQRDGGGGGGGQGSAAAAAAARRQGFFPRMIQPETNTFKGSLQPSNGSGGGGVWTLLTDKKAGDATVIGYPPVYLVQRDSPLLPSSSSKTIYYECKILPPNHNSSSSHFPHRHQRQNNNETGEIGLALGFAALPCPPFRMPGWHRGSLAVHGDDGHRYVNDRWGGKEFTAPFAPGQTVGIGMVFSSSSSSSSSASTSSSVHAPGSASTSGSGKKGGAGAGAGPGGNIEVEVFFTRDGTVEGRWDVHEELDASTDLPVTGLEGYHDLAVAVGTFQNVAVEVVLDPARWVYRGVQN